MAFVTGGLGQPASGSLVAGGLAAYLSDPNRLVAYLTGSSTVAALLAGVLNPTVFTWGGGLVQDVPLVGVGSVRRRSFDQGVTLVRDDAGEWTEVRGVLMDSQLQAYTLVLRGGYTIDVSEDTYDELVAAGYGSYFV